MGIGLALIGLNADVASAASPDHEETINLDDAEAIFENDLDNRLQTHALPTLTALHITPSDEERLLLPLAYQPSETPDLSGESIRFSSTEADLPNKQAMADLVALLSDPDSDLSILPSPTVHSRFEPTVASNSEFDSVQIANRSHGSEPAAAQGNSLNLDYPIHLSVNAPFNQTRNLDNAAGLTANRPAGLMVSVLPTQETFQSGNRFTFQPPFAGESSIFELATVEPSPTGVYISGVTTPHISLPQLPSLDSSLIGNATLTAVSPSATSGNQVPLAHLHPTLPMASLGGMPLQQGHSSYPVLIPVPAEPPMGHGRSGFQTLPPPPSLPSFSNVWATPQPFENHRLADARQPAYAVGGHATSVTSPTPYPIAPSLDFGSAAARPPQQYTTAISIPQTHSWEYATPTPSTAFALPVIGPWTPPTPTAATGDLPLESYPSSRPAAFNPSAPFAPMASPSQPSVGQFAAPNSWSSGTQTLAGSPRRVPPIASARQTLPPPLHPTAAYHPPLESAPDAFNPSAPYLSAAYPEARQNQATSPSSFAPPEPFNTPITNTTTQHWQSSNVIGQANSSLPVLIPTEPMFETAQTTPLPSSQVPASTLSPSTLSPSTNLANVQQGSLTGRTPVTPSTLQLQGAAILVDDEFSARGRLSGAYYLTPQILVGAALDVTEGESFSDSETEGFNINELYLAAALRDLPNLRFVIGQLDLTSYFDRNSFAKDSLTHFFNPTFQTNPALAANAIGSRPAALINFSPTDTIDARVAAFSSDRSIGDFDLDGFAGELGFQVGNLIIRGTYVSARDGGSNDGPAEIFSVDRGDGDFGIKDGDREESFGFNAEFFVPEANLGFFGRYGRYENLDAEFSADTFSGGFNFLDVFTPNDRLGLAYGRALSNDDERDDETPDVLEFFYDVPLLSNPNTRLGVTLQQRNEFSETVAGIRFRTTFDILR